MPKQEEAAPEQEEAAAKPEDEAVVKAEEGAPKEEEEPEQEAKRKQEAGEPTQDAAAPKRGYEAQLGLLDLHLAYLWRVRFGFVISLCHPVPPYGSCVLATRASPMFVTLHAS